ncbi:MAG: spondin domain-containing protein, partial [Marinirhabdus sp.]
LPSGAHWSKLVGATHNNGVSFLQMGQTATNGIEDIAERGLNTNFFNEVGTAISNGTANAPIDGPALGSAGGQIFMGGITTTEEFPLLTLVSMIAPSPDWMIALSGLNLLNTNGEWKDTFMVDLYPYDAGTDSGADYTSPNQDTNPKEAIVNAQGTMPFSTEKIGTLTIALKEVLGAEDTPANVLRLFPNPTSGTFTLKSNSPLSHIEIYNVLGSLVLKQAVYGNEAVLDLSRFPNGMYIVNSAGTNGNTTAKKLVKR